MVIVDKFFILEAFNAEGEHAPIAMSLDRQELFEFAVGAAQDPENIFAAFRITESYPCFQKREEKDVPAPTHIVPISRN